MTRTLVSLNGSPVAGSSVDRMLAALEQGAAAAGGHIQRFDCQSLAVRPCVACGPDATTGFCVFHDDMDRVYHALRDAHAIAVGSPVYFDGVSAQLKLVMDRCNCLTPLVTLPSGERDMVALWARTRRGVFVTACSAKHPHDLAERSVRGFLKWVGAKWEETLAYRHDDVDLASVVSHPDLLDRANAVGRRLIESSPLEP